MHQVFNLFFICPCAELSKFPKHCCRRRNCTSSCDVTNVVLSARFSTHSELLHLHFIFLPLGAVSVHVVFFLIWTFIVCLKASFCFLLAMFSACWKTISCWKRVVQIIWGRILMGVQIDAIQNNDRHKAPLSLGVIFLSEATRFDQNLHLTCFYEAFLIWSGFYSDYLCPCNRNLLHLCFPARLFTWSLCTPLLIHCLFRPLVPVSCHLRSLLVFFCSSSMFILPSRNTTKVFFCAFVMCAHHSKNILIYLCYKVVEDGFWWH